MTIPFYQTSRTVENYENGRLFRPDDGECRHIDGCQIHEFIAPGRGSQRITAVRIDIPAGHSFCPVAITEFETIGVVLGGCGTIQLGKQTYSLVEASTIYAPTGVHIRMSAALTSVMTVYLWRAPLPFDRQPSRNPRLISTLFDDTTFCRLVAGEGDPSDPAMMHFHAEKGETLAPATMHFLHWPATGSPLLCLHCGIQQPGQTFPIHRHPNSEELFIGFRGEGECYLNGEWQPMRAGDVLFAPPGLLHGARNAKHDGEPFITCGGPTPFDPVLYRLAGVSAEVL